MKADLHNHSIYSDGKLGVLDLYKLSLEKGMDLIAITDHDSVEAYKDIEKNNLKDKILIGVELSTDMFGEDIHILGYFYGNNEPSIEIREFLDSQRIKRKQRIHKVIRKLKTYYGIEITYQDVARLADGAIGRPHIAWAIEKKYAIPFKEVFDKYIGNEKKAYVPNDKLSTNDAIKLLKESNALVVVPHPCSIKKNDLESILKLGVDGIEVNYPLHDDSDRKKYLDLAKQYNLIITGGSDFHGDDISYSMGSCFVSDSYFEKFISKIYK